MLAEGSAMTDNPLNLLSQNMAQLWGAADGLVQVSLPGKAIYWVECGVMQDLPIALAVKEWQQGLWALYYDRKKLINHVRNTALFDFSVCGVPPYSLEEIQAEYEAFFPPVGAE